MSKRSILNGLFEYTVNKDTTSKQKLVKCTKCHQVFKYHHSTTTLRYHLSNKHSIYKVEDASASSSQSTLDEHIAKKPVSQTKRNTLRDDIADWITVNCRPLSVVEDSGFLQIIRTALDNTTYELPSRKLITSKISGRYSSKRDELKTLLTNCPAVAITTDGWTSLSNVSYLGVTVHYLEDWNLTAKAIAVAKMEGRHTGDNVSATLTEVLDRWDIRERTVVICTDSARNMINAIGKTSIDHLPCSAHLLQLSINKGIESSGLDRPLALARKIVGHFKHSPVHSEVLRRKQTVKENLVC